MFKPTNNVARGCRLLHCTAGEGNCERYGLIVYPKCDPSYHAVGCCVCSPDCPPGTTDIGVSCHKRPVFSTIKPLTCGPGEQRGFPAARVLKARFVADGVLMPSVMDVAGDHALTVAVQTTNEPPRAPCSTSVALSSVHTCKPSDIEHRNHTRTAPQMHSHSHGNGPRSHPLVAGPCGHAH